MLNGDPCGGLVHVEGDPWSHPDHSPAQEYVAELLGQLAAERVQDLSPGNAGLDRDLRGEGHAQGVVVPRHLQNVRSACAVELQKPGRQLLAETTRHPEFGGELLEISRPADFPAGERNFVGAAPGDLSAELLVDRVHRLAGEVAVGRKLAADNREEAAYPRVVLGVVEDYVAPRHAAFGALGLVGQRPYARVGKEYILARQVRRGDDVVRLADEVVDLFFVGDHVVQVALVADVGRANEV